MATAYKCDICGWYYESGGGLLTLANQNILFSKLTEEKYDICPKCIERFHTKFIDYTREQNSKKEQGTYDPSSRKFVPYSEEKKEESKPKDIGQNLTSDWYKSTDTTTEKKEESKPKEVRRTCKGCRYLDDVRITGKGYQCQCITNGRTFTEPSKTRCDHYERKG